MMFKRFAIAAGVCTACALSFVAGMHAQNAGGPERYVSPGGTQLSVLLDASSLGSGDIDVGEITLPAGTNAADHVHGSTEIFYVISGELEHVVNGKSTMLKPGMVGFVKPPDKVQHKTKVETKAVVIWVPGGEAARVTKSWKKIE